MTLSCSPAYDYLEKLSKSKRTRSSSSSEDCIRAQKSGFVQFVQDPLSDFQIALRDPSGRIRWCREKVYGQYDAPWYAELASRRGCMAVRNRGDHSNARQKRSRVIALQSGLHKYYTIEIY